MKTKVLCLCTIIFAFIIWPGCKKHNPFEAYKVPTIDANATHTLTITAMPQFTPTITPTNSITAPACIPAKTVITGISVDNCDDNNNQCSWSGASSGYWYTSNDICNSGDSSVWPPPWAATCGGSGGPDFQMSDWGHDNCGYAARVTGYVSTTGYINGYFTTGVNFYEPPAAVDLNGRNIRFWYKGNGSQYKVRFRTSIPGNDDTPAKVFTATSSWQFFDQPVSAFAQEGWGAPVSLTYSVSLVTAIQWENNFRPGAIDLWIDDIEVSAAPAPSHTVSPALTATVTFTATVSSTVTPVVTVADSELVYVPIGTFIQTDGSASFSHNISMFKIGKYEVTYELWYTVYQWAILPAQGYNFQNAGTEGNDGTAGLAPTAAQHEPVTTINWRDAIVWCNAYSEKSGLAPCFTYASTVIKDSRNSNAAACDNAVCVWANNGYRLPTEGEWQYAARYIDGSSWTPWNYASGATADYTYALPTGLVAWYNVNSGSVTHNAGGKNPNALGIFDMSGNVYEWCWDWYGPYPGATTDYRGPGSGSNGRIIPGGNYSIDEGYLRSGFRNSSMQYNVGNQYGFRVAIKN